MRLNPTLILVKSLKKLWVVLIYHSITKILRWALLRLAKARAKLSTWVGHL